MCQLIPASFSSSANISGEPLVTSGRDILRAKFHFCCLANSVKCPFTMCWFCNRQVLEATKALIRGHRRRRLELVNVAECQLLSERWASADCQAAMRQYLESVNDSL